MDTVTAVVTLLADEPRNTGPDFGKASPFGLLITVALLVGTFALVWSMNRHLRKLPESFDREHPEPDQAVDDGTVEPTDDDPSDNTSEERSDDRQSRESGG